LLPKTEREGKGREGKGGRREGRIPTIGPRKKGTKGFGYWRIDFRGILSLFLLSRA